MRELALYDAVVLYEDEEEQKRISEILHDLNVQRIRFSHAYSIQVGQINGT